MTTTGRFPSELGPFQTKADDTATDLRRIRGTWQELLAWLKANVSQSTAQAPALLRTGNDFTTFPAKSTPAGSDIFLFEDSAASFAKKKATLAQLAIAGTYATGSIPLSVPPAALGMTPSAIDTEMDANPSWLYYDLTNGAARTPAGTPNWITSITPNTAVPALSFTARKSWSTLQPPSNGESVYYVPGVETWVANTPVWYWTRSNIGAPFGANNVRASLAMIKPTAGVPDVHSASGAARFGGTYDTGTGIRMGSWEYSGVTLTDLSTSQLSIFTHPTFEYIGMYSDGGATLASTNVWFVIFNDNGHFHVLNGAVGGGIAGFGTYFVGFFLRNTGMGSPGQQTNILQVDFLRKSVGTTPPWWR
jgi:hypothetical protein